MPRLRAAYLGLAAYAVLGVALWGVPLLGVLHVEAAAVVAFVAFFVAGFTAVPAFLRGEAVAPVLRRQLAALLVPWALLTLTLLWRPNCDYLRGLLFYALFPGVTVVLAVALADMLTAYPCRRPRRWLGAIGLGLALLPTLYDLGFHPQFYVYNHVFGGVLGPIYDEELAVRPGLFAFRALTLLWALLGFVAARRRRQPRAVHPALPGLLMLLIGLAYLFAAPLGMNTPAWYLQKALGGVHHTPHFTLYYDPEAVPDDALRRLAEDHEYRYAQLATALDLDLEGRIASYLYPDAETKARLTGAARTNVAPVWLRQPQVHVLLSSYEGVFPHELAHVFSRAFGLPVLRASVSVGLVEGLAVALEPPDGLPTPHEQVSAALHQDAAALPEAAEALVDRLAGQLTPWGFWTGRGAVSYTTMGSFVRYLLDQYGAAPFKAVYAGARFEAVYGRPPEVLAQGWVAHLRRLPVVARSAAPLVRQRFAVPSLFERPCPHHVPAYLRRYRAGMAALGRADTTAALSAFEEALAQAPTYTPALDSWARLTLAHGAAAAVQARLDTLAHGSPLLTFRLGDAQALTGQPDSARAAYLTAYHTWPLYADEARSLMLLRHHLADHPDLLRHLLSAPTDSSHTQALVRLAGTEPAVGWLVARRYAQAGAADEALRWRRQTPAPSSPTFTKAQNTLLHRQRLAQLAEAAYLAQQPEAARLYALEAASAFEAVGDRHPAHRLRDFADKMAWLTAAARQNPAPPEPAEAR